MKWGTKIKYTAFIVLCSLAFAVSGISGVFSSFKTGGTSGFSIYYTAPKPVNLKSIQFATNYSTATSITFDYYNDEYNTLIANATSSYKVDENGDGSIMLYKVGTSLYVLSNGDIYAPTSCLSMFNGMGYLTSIKFNNFNTSNVTNMRYMFGWCDRLTSLDLSPLDTSKVTDMSYMFIECSGLQSLDLSPLDTSKVTDMRYMFNNCSGLTELDLTPLDTSNVTDMSHMFSGSGLLSLDLSGFNTSKVTTMLGMFMSCSALKFVDLSNFDTSRVTTIQQMFDKCSSLNILDLSNFNTRGVNISYMFRDCTRLTTIYISNSWSTSGISSTTDMFSGCTYLVGGNGTVYDSSYTSANYARNDTTEYPGYLTNINGPFALGAIRLVNHLSTATSVTFDYYNEEYNEIISNATSTYIVGKSAEDEATLYIVGTDIYILSNSEIYAHSNCSYMFSSMTALKSITFNNFNTSNVVNMEWMFAYCSDLSILDLSGFDTGNVTDMTRMFRYCDKLLTVYVSDTWKVATTSAYITENCTNMRGGNNFVNIINGPFTLGGILFNTYLSTATSVVFDYYNEEYNEIISNATNMYIVGKTSSKEDIKMYIVGTALYILSDYEIYAKVCYNMFDGMSSLQDIIFNNFNTSNITDMSYMFNHCRSLRLLDLSGFNTSKVTNMSYMFQYCSDLSTIWVNDTWSTSKVSSSSYMFYSCDFLVGGNGTQFNNSSTSYMGATYARIDAVGTPGYFTDVNGALVLGLGNISTYLSTATSVTFDYYNEEYNSIISNATSIHIVGKTTTQDIKLYVVGTEVYILSDYEIYAKSCYYMFDDMSSLKNIIFNNFNTSKVTNMFCMFSDCSGLTSLDLSPLDTSNVTNMGFMFCNCSGLTSLDLTPLDTSNVTSMSGLFDGCSGLTTIDLSLLDTSEVTDMSYMFDDCSKLISLDLSSFTTSKLQTVEYMFYKCSKLTTIYVSRAITASYSQFMFDSCYNLVGGNGTRFSATKVHNEYAKIDYGGVNSGYYTIKTDILTLGGIQLTNYASSATSVTFDYYNAQYNTIIANATESYIVGMSTEDKATLYVVGTNVYILSNSEIYAHKSCYYMFGQELNYNNSLKSITFNNFNTSNVTDMSYMFRNCATLTTICVSSSWSTTKVTSSTDMFYACTRLVGGNGTGYNSSYIDKTYARIDTADTPGYLTDINNISLRSWILLYASSATTLTFDYYNVQYNELIAKASVSSTITNGGVRGDVYLVGTDVYMLSEDTIYATSCHFIFRGLASLTSIQFNNFNTTNVTNMSYMFYGCSGLTSLDLSPLETGNVTSMSGMFYGCSGLTSLDLSPLDTTNVTDMSYMFNNCSGLTSLDLSPLDTTKVTDMSSMFSNCSGLTSLDLSGWDTINVTNMSYMFYYCSGLISLDLSSWDTSNVTNMSNMFYHCSGLTTIYVSSSWSTTKVTNSANNMFYYCSKLVGGNGTKYSSSYLGKTYARIDTASTPGYLTAKP